MSIFPSSLHHMNFPGMVTHFHLSCSLFVSFWLFPCFTQVPELLHVYCRVVVSLPQTTIFFTFFFFFQVYLISLYCLVVPSHTAHRSNSRLVYHTAQIFKYFHTSQLSIIQSDVCFSSQALKCDCLLRSLLNFIHHTLC